MEENKEVQQLDMGLKEPVSNKFKNFKYKVELFFIKLRTNSLFTTPFLWISASIVVSLILVQAYYYVNFFEKLPNEIPLFSITRNPELSLVNRDSLLWILILSIFLTVFSFTVALKMYYKFKVISIFIMTNIVICIFFLTISYIKIFGIYIF